MLALYLPLLKYPRVLPLTVIEIEVVVVLVPVVLIVVAPDEGRLKEGQSLKCSWARPSPSKEEKMSLTPPIFLC